MLALSVVILVVNCLVALVWTSRHYLVYQEKRKGAPLGPAHPGPPNEAPKISVVVAAKDEQDNIEQCVRTMLVQDYPSFDVLVCNDRSEDDTAAIVERLAAEDPRVRLLNIEHLPDGWCGKNNAMQTGIGTTDGEWICMIDADCRQISPRTLSVAMQHAQDHDADLLSVLPTLEMCGFWENVVQPVCGGVMMIWFNPDKVNDPARPDAYANGAFMLMKRSAYEAVGRHETVKDRVNEDMHLALRVKTSGLSLRVVRSRDLYVVRMYTSLRKIVRGWSRIFYGTFCTFRRLLVSLLVLVFMGLLPYAAAGLGFALGAAGTGPTGVWLACGIVGAVGAAMQISVIGRFYKLIQARPGLCWTYPIGCAAAVLAVLLGMGKLRRGATVVWRGTTYSGPAQ